MRRENGGRKKRAMSGFLIFVLVEKKWNERNSEVKCIPKGENQLDECSEVNGR